MAYKLEPRVLYGDANLENFLETLSLQKETNPANVPRLRTYVLCHWLFGLGPVFFLWAKLCASKVFVLFWRMIH